MIVHERPGEAARSDARVLCKREDVEELDVEPVRGQRRHLGDSVPLLEAQEELLAEVLGRVELVEAEPKRRGLLAGDEEDERLDVVRAPELVALVEREVPVLTFR